MNIALNRNLGKCNYLDPIDFCKLPQYINLSRFRLHNHNLHERRYMDRFVDYVTDPRSLAERLAAIMSELEIAPEQAITTHAFLAPLQHKGPVYYVQYEHSVRVMLLAVSLGKFMHLDQRALFYASILHDVGKIQVPPSTLGKVSGWNDRDRQLVRRHVMDGYRMLAGRFNYAAQIMLWHHRFQNDKYPKKPPAPLQEYDEGTKVSIGYLGRMLALCDVYDALHRIDGRHEARGLTGEEIREKMYAYNRDQKHLLDELYEGGIFTTFTRPAI
jgi:hypothetical protein